MTTQKTITAFYQEDHDRLDALFQKFRGLKRSNFDEARACFRQFNQGLLRHIRWEEEILFPFFEIKTGMKDSGPTAVMRFEHQQIKKALNAIHEKVRANDAECEDSEAALIEVLTDHNVKEEGILYPALDQMATQPELNDMFERMDKIAAEPSVSCCGLTSR